MKGQYQGATEIILLHEGGTGKRAWKLYGTDILVDGKSYGFTRFSKTEIEERLEKLKEGMQIEFETEERGDFVNVKKKTEINVLAQPSAGYKPSNPTALSKPVVKKPTVPFMSDKDVFALMDKCIEAIDKSLAKQEITVQSLAETTTMINSVFIACREERKTQRRWE